MPGLAGPLEGESPPPRIAPLPKAGRTPEQQALLDDFVAPPTTINVYETMARNPNLLARCIPLGRALRSGRLSLRNRELLILRSGWLCGSRYELAQHTRLALGGGMTADEVKRVADGPSAPGWGALDVALLTAADELHSDAVISETTWQALAVELDEQELIEVPMVCGYYHLISFFLNSLGVQLERAAAEHEVW